MLFTSEVTPHDNKTSGARNASRQTFTVSRVSKSPEERIWIKMIILVTSHLLKMGKPFTENKTMLVVKGINPARFI